MSHPGSVFCPREVAFPFEVVACHQVYRAFLLATQSDPSAHIEAFLDDPAYPSFCEDLLRIAQNLCPLEALSHRTEEVAAALTVLQSEMAALDSRVPWTAFPVSLRIFAGVALAQLTWLDEVDYLAQDESDREHLLLESPSWSVESFL